MDHSDFHLDFLDLAPSAPSSFNCSDKYGVGLIPGKSFAENARNGFDQTSSKIGIFPPIIDSATSISRNRSRYAPAVGIRRSANTKNVLGPGSIFSLHELGFPGPFADSGSVSTKKGLTYVFPCMVEACSSSPEGPGRFGDLGAAKSWHATTYWLCFNILISCSDCGLKSVI